MSDHVPGVVGGRCDGLRVGLLILVAVRDYVSHNGGGAVSHNGGDAVLLVSRGFILHSSLALGAGEDIG